jgi:hypothetical protein
MSQEPAPRDDHEAYYERAAWPAGTSIQDPDDPTRHGTLVRPCARLWVDRDRRPPLVRWHGTTDAVPIPWHELHRVTGSSAIIEQAVRTGGQSPPTCTCPSSLFAMAADMVRSDCPLHAAAGTRLDPPPGLTKVVIINQREVPRDRGNR